MESTIPAIKPIPNLSNILQKKSLRWIFVGGKGGVGKTTISSSLSIELSRNRSKVLLISTDPAHNLSDAFNQKISSAPTLIKGFTNLYAIELDPKEFEDEEDNNMSEIAGVPIDDEAKDIFTQLKNSIPGIDEAICIGMLLQVIDKYEFETVVFDTAPTGHTLRMLSFPSLLEQGLTKLNEAKNGIGGVLGNLLAQSMGELTGIMETIEIFKKSIENVHKEFTKKEHTTFIAVCIPEFLSMYETERLMQELEKDKIDCHNIVINMVLFPEEGCECDMCTARFEMQKKYINQIREIYEDKDGENMKEDNEGMNISILPFQEDEVRGAQELLKFTKFLV